MDLNKQSNTEQYKTAYLILRQSKRGSKRNDMSNQRQKLMCEKYCKTFEYEISGVLENVCLAWKNNKYFTELYNFIEKMNNDSIIVVYKIDRICRNIEMGKRLLKLMNDKHLQVHSLFEGANLSTYIFDFRFSKHVSLFIKKIKKGEEESMVNSNRQKLVHICRNEKFSFTN